MIHKIMKIKLICMVVIFNSVIMPQVFEGLTVLHSVASGYNAYFQMRDRHFYANGNTEMKEKYNRRWHYAGGVELSLSIVLGVSSALKNKSDLWKYGKDLLLFSAVRWFVRDGIYNTLNNNSYFHRSQNSTAILEPLGTWYFKTGYLILAIIFYYLDL